MQCERFSPPNTHTKQVRYQGSAWIMYSWQHHFMPGYTVPAIQLHYVLCLLFLLCRKNYYILKILYFLCVLSQWVTHQSVWPGDQLAQCRPGWRSGWKNVSASWFCCRHEKERQQGYSCFWTQETGKIQQEEEGKRNKYDFRIWPDSLINYSRINILHVE